jgi:anti-sigma factor ChrR (cupin superfamily)
MDHDEAALLLGAYAVHALENDENLQVLAHLESCGWCRAEASRYERVLSVLGDTTEPDDAA